MGIISTLKQAKVNFQKAQLERQRKGFIKRELEIEKLKQLETISKQKSAIAAQKAQVRKSRAQRFSKIAERLEARSKQSFASNSPFTAEIPNPFKAPQKAVKTKKGQSAKTIIIR